MATPVSGSLARLISAFNQKIELLVASDDLFRIELVTVRAHLTASGARLAKETEFAFAALAADAGFAFQDSHLDSLKVLVFLNAQAAFKTLTPALQQALNESSEGRGELLFCRITTAVAAQWTPPIS